MYLIPTIRLAATSFVLGLLASIVSGPYFVRLLQASTLALFFLAIFDPKLWGSIVTWWRNRRVPKGE